MSEVNDFTLSQDLKNIRDLCESKTIVVDSSFKKFTLEEFIDDKKLIIEWPHHNRCLNCMDIKKKNGFNNLNFDSPSIDESLAYLEYVANLVQLFADDKEARLKSLTFAILPSTYTEN